MAERYAGVDLDGRELGTTGPSNKSALARKLETRTRYSNSDGELRFADVGAAARDTYHRLDSNERHTYAVITISL